MASYIRQSTFSDGDLITAELFNNEYNQLVAVFDNATGHRHDGTVGEGPVISVLGDAGLSTPLNKILVDTTNDHIEFWIDVSGTSTQQLYIADGAIVPATNNDVDLGTSASKFKDLYLSGTANITGNAVVTGNLTVEGTTVTLNTATLDVEDKNITLNYGTGDTSSNADGAGITIQDAVNASTDATILWNAANDRFDFSHAIDVTGTITSDGFTVDATGSLAPNSGNLELSSSNTGIIYDAQNGYHTFKNNGTNSLQINGGTNHVNIVSGNLELNGSTTITNNKTAYLKGVYVSDAQPTLRLLDTDATNQYTDFFMSASYALFQNRNDTANGGFIFRGSNGSVNTEYMRILPSGNIGINTTSPSSTLDVNGTITYGSLSDGTITITGFVDEDNMSSNSATLVPTQQSVKAYVDSQVGTVDTLSEILANGNTTGGTDIEFGDNDRAIFGASNDLRIFHDGNHSYIEDGGTGNLRVRATNLNLANLVGNNYINCVSGGAVTLYHNNSSKLATSSTGIDVTGRVTAENAIFGTTSDSQTIVQIISSTTGESELRMGDTDTDAGSISYTNSNDTLTFRAAAANRMSLNSSGLDVTGTVTSDGLTVNNVESPMIELTDLSTGNELQIYADNSGGVIRTSTDDDLFLRTNSLNRIKLDNTGDISFYDDTGSMQGLFWDASTERLGIGTTSPASPLHLKVAGTGGSNILSLENDSNKYDFRLSGSDLLIRDGSLDRIALDSSGNVGIGTSSPSAKLDVDGGVSINSGLLNLDTGYAIRWGGSASGIYSGSGNSDMVFTAGSSERFRVNGLSGNVGIGTTNPQAKLQINDGDLYFDNDSYSDSNRIGFGNPARDGDAGYIDYIGVGNFTGHLAFGLVTSATNTAATEVARFNNAGNFGIGQTSPNTKLHVDGDIRLQNSGKVYLWNDHNLNYIDYTKWQSSASAGMTINNSANGFLRFNTNNIERVKITADGNVGIGTSSPSGAAGTALAINGGASQARLALKNTNSGDGTGDGLQIVLTDGDAGIEQRENLPLYFKTNNVEAMRITNSQNVGIGTSSPTQKLEVDGAVLIKDSNTEGTLYLTNTSVGVKRSNAVDTANSRDIEIFTDGGGANVVFSTNGAGSAEMVVSDSGNVGIGAAPSTHSLEVWRSGGDHLLLGRAGVGTYELGVSTDNALTFEDGGSERMRIDSAGNLKVSTTNGAPSLTNVVGIVLRSEGHIYASRDGGVVGYFNRKTTDGTILDFRKDGVNVGSIGTYASDLTIGDDDVGIRFDTGTGLVPWDLGANSTGGSATNGTIDLGVSGAAFKDLHLSGTAYIGGDLEVSGTTTTINTANLNVEDKNITLNYSTGDSSSTADGAGITIQDAVNSTTDATILWNATNDEFDFSHGLDVTGAITSTGQFSVNTGATGTLAQFRGADTDLLNIDGDSNAITLDARNVGALNIEMQGTNALTIDNSQNVGIGTTSPSEKLTISASNSGGANNNTLRFVDTDVTTQANQSFGKIEFETKDANNAGVNAFINAFAEGTGGTGALSFGTGSAGSTERMRIDSSGNVGIGTDSPTEKLTVRKDVSAGDGATALLGIYARGGAAGEDAEIYLGHSASRAAKIVAHKKSSGNDHDLSFSTNADASAPTEKMRITSAGNVGIGTTSPTGKLNIVSGSSGSYLINLDYNDNTDGGGFYESGSTGLTLFMKDSSANTDVQIATEGVSYFNGGNVGIGTTSPSEKLTVDAQSADGVTTTIASFHSNEGESGDTAIQLAVRRSDALGSDRRTFLNATGAGNFEIQRSGSTKAVIDGSGNVGIGTSSPDNELHISDSTGNAVVQIEASATGFSQISFGDVNDGDVGKVKYDHSDNSMSFTTSTSEAMRIDSSGNLFVNQTATGDYTDTAGSSFRATGFSTHTRDGGDVLLLNRLSSDGNILLFRKDNTTVGSIGSETNSLVIDVPNNGNALIFEGSNTSGTTTRLAMTNAGGSEAFRPFNSNSDALFNLGSSSRRFKDLHLSGTGYFGTAVGIGTTSPRSNYSLDVRNAANNGVNIQAGDAAADVALSVGSAGTADKFVITAGGSVGIGTTSPSGLFSLEKGTRNLDFKLESTPASGDAGVQITAGAGDYLGLYAGSSNGELLLGSNGVERMRINSSGNVGIGVSSPTRTLQIVSTGTTTGGTYLYSNAIHTGTDTQSLLSVRSDNASATGTVVDIRGDGTGDILHVKDGTNTALIVEDGGSVGMGTSNPSSLDINGNRLVVGGGSGNEGMTIFSGTTGLGTILFADGNDGSNAEYRGWMQYEHTNDSLEFATASAERMRIDSSGNVGIGTTSPSQKLHVRSSATTEILAQSTSANVANSGRFVAKEADSAGYGAGLRYDGDSNTGSIFGITTNNDNDVITWSRGGGDVQFKTSSQERMRIDSSGNLLVGTTDNNVTNNTGNNPGINIGVAGIKGYIAAARYQGASLALNRLDNDGDIAVFAKDGTTVGSIGSNSGALFIVGDTTSGNGAGLKFIDGSTERIVPATSGGGEVDNLVDLGQSTHRFKDLHLSGIAYTNNIRAAGGSDLSLQTDEGVARIHILDSDGSVGIGTTAPATHLHIAGPKDTASSPVVRIQHSLATNTDGPLVDFQNNAQTVRGAIGTRQSETNTNLYISGGNTGLKFLNYITYKAIYPVGGDGSDSDDTIDLGASSVRFDDIYATNGTIQTSDRNEKQDIQELSEAEQRVATACKGLIRRYKFNKAVTEKGDDARYHFGIIAQDLQDAFTAEGLDAGDYGMFISSTWEDSEGVEHTRLGVRYNELLAFIIATL